MINVSSNPLQYHNSTKPVLFTDDITEMADRSLNAVQFQVPAEALLTWGNFRESDLVEAVALEEYDSLPAPRQHEAGAGEGNLLSEEETSNLLLDYIDNGFNQSVD